MKRSFNTCKALLLALLVCQPACGEEASSALFQAIRNGRQDIVRSLLNIMPTNAINAKTGAGVSPLHLASALNRQAIVKMLLANSADVNSRTDNGFQPLHWAAGRDAVDAAILLLAAGADVNATTTDGITPLHWAASKNATNMVKFLLLADADIARTTASGLAPLHWAVMNESSQSAEYIAKVEVSEQLSIEAAQRNNSKTDEIPAEPPDTEISTIPATDPNSGPVFQEGHHLTLPLGIGEDMSFVWLEPMHLWAGQYEVSNSEFRRFQQEHSSRALGSYSLNSNDQPVVFVSWHDADAFCRWLNTRYASIIPSNFTFRLPTSTEWKQMARCGTDRKYPWGDKLPPAYGNYSDKTARDALVDWEGLSNYKDGFPVTCPVTLAGTNEWGLVGIGGNVWEWSSSWSDKDLAYKIRHGASWSLDTEKAVEIDYAGLDRPQTRLDNIGFRVVAAPVQ